MNRIEKSFADNLAVLSMICKTMVRTGRVLEQEYGVPSMDLNDPRLSPRSLSRMPVVFESGVTKQVTLDLEKGNRQIIPSRGFYSNIGDDAFQVTLEGLEGDAMPAHTLPPGTSIAITSYVTKITIIPLSGTAKYQVMVQ
jgi:hypothetical protein